MSLNFCVFVTILVASKTFTLGEKRWIDFKMKDGSYVVTIRGVKNGITVGITLTDMEFNALMDLIVPIHSAMEEVMKNP